MLKIIISTFMLVFVAELGDKTQITTMLLSADSNSKMAVFLGSALALVCSSFVGVILGSVLNKYIPPGVIQKIAAVAFVVIGTLLFFNKI
jgi:putative Ca2+/H+ antiporter (TMEM165/GDT1 family)